MKLLIADDHTLFRDALVQYIERAEQGAEVLLAKDFHDAYELIQSDSKLDLIILDLRMPGMHNMEGFKTLRENYPEIPVALMSGVAEEKDVCAAMDLGACGYFPKTLSGKALLKAIQLVLTGERFIPIKQETNDIMPSYYSDGSDALESRVYGGINDGSKVLADKGIDCEEIYLTPRESEVLSYIALGMSNKEIARELDLQVVTVKLHVRGVCRKLEAKNRTQAAMKAHQMGLVSASKVS